MLVKYVAMGVLLLAASVLASKQGGSGKPNANAGNPPSVGQKRPFGASTLPKGTTPQAPQPPPRPSTPPRSPGGTLTKSTKNTLPSPGSPTSSSPNYGGNNNNISPSGNSPPSPPSPRQNVGTLSASAKTADRALMDFVTYMIKNKEFPPELPFKCNKLERPEWGVDCDIHDLVSPAEATVIVQHVKDAIESGLSKEKVSSNKSLFNFKSNFDFKVTEATHPNGAKSKRFLFSWLAYRVTVELFEDSKQARDYLQHMSYLPFNWHQNPEDQSDSESEGFGNDSDDYSE